MVEPFKIPSPESSDQVILSRKDYEALIGLNHKLQSDNLYLHHELEKLKRMIFGAKSERFIPSDTSQLSLELGQTAQPPVEKPIEEISYARQKADKKKGHARMEISPAIPRVVMVIEPVEDVTGASKIGEVITEVPDYVNLSKNPSY